MKCPNCPDANLMMSDRQGVELDYCLKCGGVWLDRGEQDKLIERAAQPRDEPAAPRPPPGDHDRRRDRGGDAARGRRRSWLSEIFY